MQSILICFVYKVIYLQFFGTFMQGAKNTGLNLKFFTMSKITICLSTRANMCQYYFFSGKYDDEIFILEINQYWTGS